MSVSVYNAAALPTSLTINPQSITDPGPGPLTRRTTEDLAERAQTIIVDMLESGNDSQNVTFSLRKRPSKIPDEVPPQLRDINNVLQLIREKLPQNPSLEGPLHEMVEYCKRVKANLSKTSRWPRWKPDPELHQNMLHLDKMKQELNSRVDIQVVSAMSRLEKQAATTSKRYSNADLANFFNHKIDGWQMTRTSVYVQPLRTAAEVTLRSANNDEVRINSILTDSFRVACDGLAGYLSCFSLPIDDVFPPAERDALSPGEIRLQTTPRSRAPIILWVYYNVFVRIELLDYKNAESTTTSKDLFWDLEKQLRSYIQAGSVLAREQATFPEIIQIKEPPSVTVGKTFVVEITVDLQDFHEVICESNNLIYAKYEDTMTTRKFIFRATKAGKGIIHFCFAHHQTLNSVTRRVQVEIQNTEEVDKVELGSRSAFGTSVVMANLRNKGFSLA